MQGSGLPCGRGNATASLENYTFLTPDISTSGLNVYACLEERILRGLSNDYQNTLLHMLPHLMQGQK